MDFVFEFGVRVRGCVRVLICCVGNLCSCPDLLGRQPVFVSVSKALGATVAVI
ncbi:hypothetical protein M6B38_160610 [Iris pallida]|uniref:Uncharacterized protein n=1 Tax=Iris pallida TaxID=29817 RepID=A0AAX6EZY4_IRIPA|nr:hypothetical protein M6B38_160610 [Iris pallida]